MESKALAKQLVSSLTYNANKQPGAILLNGAWGAGKTYFWEKELLPLLKKKPVMYVSLFGVKSSDDFKMRLITAVASTAGSAPKSWAESFVRSLPGAVSKGLESVAEKYLGKEAVHILEKLNLKVDPLDFFPKNTIVCVDDFERSKLDPDETLGVLNFLVEHKEASLLIIANENYLTSEKSSEPFDKKRREIYKQFKEKLIWRTVGFEVPLEDVFDSFVEEYATSNKKAIRTAKDVILDTLKSGGNKNLRTLQKVIRTFDQVLSVGAVQLEENQARFLTAIIDEEARIGLKDDPSIYAKNYSRSPAKKEVDIESESEKIGREFFSKYFSKHYVVGFCHGLYSLVRTGILDEELLLSELLPEDEKLDTAGKLCKAFWNGFWRYETDKGIKAFAAKIEKFLRGSGKATPLVLIRLYGALVKVLSQIDEAVPPDLVGVMHKRVIFAATDLKNDRPFERFEFLDEEESRAISPLIDTLAQARIDAHAEASKKEALAALAKYRMPEIIITDPRQASWSVPVITDPLVLDAAEKMYDKRPDMHHMFYSEAIKKVLATEKTKVALLTDRLHKRLSKNSDKGTIKRLKQLIESAS